MNEVVATAPDPCECRHPGGLELTERAVELARLAAGARVLDVGCGLGTTVAHLEAAYGLRATGVDCSGAAVEQGLAAWPGADLRVGRAESLPFAGPAFAAVFMECVLSTVLRRRRALEEARRVLVPGGRIVLADLYVRSREEEGGVRPRALPSLGTRDEIEDLVRSAGFAVTVWEDHSSALAQLLWDLAGMAIASPSVEGERRPAAHRARRLGYCICVARAPRESASTVEGATDAGS